MGVSMIYLIMIKTSGKLSLINSTFRLLLITKRHHLTPSLRLLMI